MDERSEQFLKVQQAIAVEATLEVLLLETTKVGRLFRKVDKLTGRA